MAVQGTQCAIPELCRGRDSRAQPERHGRNEGLWTQRRTTDDGEDGLRTNRRGMDTGACIDSALGIEHRTRAHAPDALLKDLRPAPAHPSPRAERECNPVPSAQEDHQPDCCRTHLPRSASSRFSSPQRLTTHVILQVSRQMSSRALSSPRQPPTTRASSAKILPHLLPQTPRVRESSMSLLTSPTMSSLVSTYISKTNCHQTPPHPHPRRHSSRLSLYLSP